MEIEEDLFTVEAAEDSSPDETDTLGDGPGTKIITNQRHFTPMEYMIKRWSITALSISLGAILLSVMAPFLINWFLTQTEIGAEMLDAVLDNVKNGILNWIYESGNPFLIFVVIAFLPFILLFMLVYYSWVLGTVLLMINFLPFLLLSIIKKILESKILGERGFKVYKNWIAKTTIAIKKIILYPILFIVFIVLIIYLIVSSQLEGTISLEFEFEDTVELLETMSAALQLFLAAYSAIISGISAFFDAKYIPPKPDSVGTRALDTLLDITGLDEDMKEEEIEVEEISQFFEPEDEYEYEYVEEAYEEIPEEEEES